MAPMRLEADGTLLADGTLRFDAAPGFPPGRVHAVLSAVDAAAPAGESLTQYVLRARQEAEVRGHQFQGAPEIHAWLEELRAEDSPNAQDQ